MHTAFIFDCGRQNPLACGVDTEQQCLADRVREPESEAEETFPEDRPHPHGSTDFYR